MVSVVSEISESEISDIVTGFQKNDQLHNSFYLNNKSQRLCNFLNAATGNEFIIDGRNISVEDDDIEDIVPF